jgi:DNA primase
VKNGGVWATISASNDAVERGANVMAASTIHLPIPPQAVDDAAIARQVNLLVLAGADTALEAVAEGEYAGACPFCGGRDRFRVRPYAVGGGRWRCRNCTPGGEDEATWPDAVEYAARRRGLGYLDACRYLLGPLALPVREPARRPVAAKLAGLPLPPSGGWQKAAEEAAARCAERLAVGAAWLAQQGVREGAAPERDALADAPEAAHAFLVLREMGLSPETIGAAGLGFNPAWEELPGGHWLAAGITIPTRADGALWALRVRMNPRFPGDTRRYQQLPGPRGQILFNLEALHGHVYGIVVEDELDALLLHQEAAGYAAVGAYPNPSALPRRWRRALGHLRHLFIYAPDKKMPREGWISALKGGPADASGVASYRAQGGSLHGWVRAALATTDDAEKLAAAAEALLAALPEPRKKVVTTYRELAETAGPFFSPALAPGRLSMVRVAEDWSEWTLYDEGRFVRNVSGEQARAVALGQVDPLLLAVGELVAR